jgi:hypothetical protein
MESRCCIKIPEFSIPANQYSAAVPASAFPYNWFSAVRSSGRQFKKDRLDLICKAFEKQAGMELFQKK